MMMKVEDGNIFIKAKNREEESVVKSWHQMRKNEAGQWVGRASLPLLENIKRNGGLIPAAKKEMERLAHIQEAVDRERTRPAGELKPMAEYPVKPNLYAHQMRAANMALMVFGMVAPPKQEVGN